jgi:hypothetical protein
MTLREGGFDWIDKKDGSWDIYTTDRKIAHITQNSTGYWHVVSDPDHTFPDSGELIRIVDRGLHPGF